MRSSDVEYAMDAVWRLMVGEIFAAECTRCRDSSAVPQVSCSHDIARAAFFRERAGSNLVYAA